MKLTFAFAFNGGHLTAEVDNFADADAVINYALSRGVVTAPAKQEAAPEVEPAAAPEVEDVVAEESAAVTVEDAQQAVKNYAARNGIEKGRELLGKFGLKRTGEITPEQAAEIVGACND